MPSISMKRPLPCTDADSAKHCIDEKELEVSTAVVIDRVKNLIEKKIRNLEKRKTKLEQAQSDLKAGKALTKEQEKAVEYLTEVEIQVNLARDILRSVQQMAVDEHYNKPKVARDIAINTVESCDYNIEKSAMLSKVMEIQTLLNDMNKDDVRRCFLKPTAGTIQLTNDQMELLDECYHNLCPSLEDTMDKEHRKIICEKASVFSLKLLQNSNETLPNKIVTFAELHKLLNEISKCDYFDHVFPPTRSDTLVSDSGVSSVSTLQSPSAGSTQPSPTGQSSATTDVQEAPPPIITSVADVTIPVPLPAVWPLPPPPQVFFPSTAAGSFLIDQRQPSVTAGGYFAPTHVPLIALPLPPIGVDTMVDSRGYVYDQDTSQLLPFIEQPDFNFQHDDGFYRTMDEPNDPSSVTDNYQSRDLIDVNNYVDVSQLSLKSKALDPNAPAFVSRLKSGCPLTCNRSAKFGRQSRSPKSNFYQVPYLQSPTGFVPISHGSGKYPGCQRQFNNVSSFENRGFFAFKCPNNGQQQQYQSFASHIGSNRRSAKHGGYHRHRSQQQAANTQHCVTETGAADPGAADQRIPCGSDRNSSAHDPSFCPSSNGNTEPNVVDQHVIGHRAALMVANCDSGTSIAESNVASVSEGISLNVNNHDVEAQC